MLLRGAFQCLLLCFSTHVTAADHAEPAKREADVLWELLTKLTANYGEMSLPLPRAISYRVREVALEFYERYPLDPRSVVLRSAFFAENPDHPLSPFGIALANMATRREQQEQGVLNPDAQMRKLLAVIEDPKLALDPEFRRFRIGAEFSMLTHYIWYGEGGYPGVERERAYYLRLKDHPDPTVRELAAGRERFTELQEKPLELELSLVDGGAISVGQQRGKVVLLDMWNLGCGSCIGAMPRMQVLYEKYRDRGFQVIGVFLDADEDALKQATNKRRAIEIMQKQGATWPDAIIAGREATSFTKHYGLWGVPQVWLLDPTGRLVRNVSIGEDYFYGARAGQSGIERDIERLLGAAKG